LAGGREGCNTVGGSTSIPAEGRRKFPSFLPYTSTAIRIRRPGRTYQPGGLQENYLTLRDTMVISIEKYQQNA
jgi:hypothetical protein